MRMEYSMSRVKYAGVGAFNSDRCVSCDNRTMQRCYHCERPVCPECSIDIDGEAYCKECEEDLDYEEEEEPV